VEEAAAILATARRPLVLAGQGCADAVEPLRELIEQLGAPLVTTSSGRGVLPEDHPLAVAFDYARGTVESLNELVGEADAVLVIGAKLGPVGSAGFRLRLPQKGQIRVDTSAEPGRAYPAHIHLGSRAQIALPALNDALRRRKPTPGGWPADEVARWKRRMRRGVHEAEPLVGGARLSSTRLFFKELRTALPRTGIVATDSGLHQKLLLRHFEFYTSRGLILPSDFQSMGYGLPAAIGARLAAPDRAVVAVVGDGGFAMSGLELLTAVREKLPLTVVVFADGVLNRIRLDQLARYGRSSDVTLRNPDFARFAESVGARYLRYEPGTESLARAIGSNEVTLVEVPMVDSAGVHLRQIKGLARGTARRVLDMAGRMGVRARASRHRRHQ
jgi:acetolactate synthase-1/2/3 large subunit